MPDLIPEHTKRNGEGPEVEAAFDYVARVAHVPLPPGVTVPAWHGWGLREAFLAGCSYVRAQEAKTVSAMPRYMKATNRETMAAYNLGLKHGTAATHQPVKSDAVPDKTLFEADKPPQDAAQPEKVALCFDSPPEYGYYESSHPYHYIFLRVPSEVLRKQLKICDLITVNYSKWPLPTFYRGLGTVKFAIEDLDCREPGDAVVIKAVPVLPKDESTEMLGAAIKGAAVASTARARQASQSESAEFSDEEIMSMMPESLHRDLADIINMAYPLSAAFSQVAPLGFAPGSARTILNAGIVEHCRKVLAAERAKRLTKN